LVSSAELGRETLIDDAADWVLMSADGGSAQSKEDAYAELHAAQPPAFFALAARAGETAARFSLT
jgi:hypothetical protein